MYKSFNEFMTEAREVETLDESVDSQKWVAGVSGITNGLAKEAEKLSKAWTDARLKRWFDPKRKSLIDITHAMEEMERTTEEYFKEIEKYKKELESELEKGFKRYT